MRHSLHSHILYLENLIRDVNKRLDQPALLPEETEDLELQLALAEGALAHYRQAYALELSASGSEPPGNPAGSESKGDGKQGSETTMHKKKDGLAGVLMPVRRLRSPRAAARIHAAVCALCNPAPMRKARSRTPRAAGA